MKKLVFLFSELKETHNKKNIKKLNDLKFAKDSSKPKYKSQKSKAIFKFFKSKNKYFQKEKDFLFCIFSVI